MVHHYGSYRDVAEQSKSEAEAATPTSCLPVKRPTPSFIQDKVSQESDLGRGVNDTIPWAEPDLSAMAGDGGAKVNTNTSTHFHVAEVHIHHSPTPTPAPCHHSPSPTPAPCRPAPPPTSHAPCCPLPPGIATCHARCRVAHEPALCGSGIVRFGQRMFVDDICHPAVYDNCHDQKCRDIHHDHN